MPFDKNTLVNKILPEMFYRLHTLMFGAISEKELECIINDKIIGHQGKSFIDHIKLQAYTKELLSYVTAMDSWVMGKQKDPFLDHPMIYQHFDEFSAFSKTQEYQPAGMVNTQLLLLYSLIRHTQPEIFIESGTHSAYSSVFIAEALKQNNNGAELHCLSLFETPEIKTTASQRLSPYPFANIHEGYSEKTIDDIAKKFQTKRCAFLIDGPKASSPAWDVLLEKIHIQFENILFISFDAAQEHLPYYGAKHEQLSLKRFINRERLKIIRLFTQAMKSKGYELSIQSNDFCLKHKNLNDEIYRYRNENWGISFPWKPYQFSKLNHVAHSPKLATIYKPEILSSVS